MPPTRASFSRPRPVPAVARAADILHALGDGQNDASLTDLARSLGIYKSTAYSILATLTAHDLVTRDPATRRYRLGPALVPLGLAAARRGGLAALAHPHLERLMRLSGETATLHVPAGRGSVILASEESLHELKVTASPGHSLPEFAGSVTKIFLAFGPAERALPARLPAFTPRSITDPARYRRELCHVRRTGVAHDEMEYLPGVRAVSAPVCGGWPAEAEDVIASLSIVCVAARISRHDMDRLVRPLRRAAVALSQALGISLGLEEVHRRAGRAQNGRRQR
jgi:DNA-binding IclR family transcriptional regulator